MSLPAINRAALSTVDPGSRLRPQRFATSGGGILFAPARKGDPYGYEEVEANG